MQNMPSGSQPVPIAAMCFNYNRLRDDAYTAGLINITNEQLYDIAGKNPYETKTLFAAAPLLTGFNSLSIQFLLKHSLYFTNSGKTITSLNIDPGDGNGFRIINWDVPFSITYPNYGNKVFILKVIFSDGTSLLTHSKIAIFAEPTLKSNSSFRYIVSNDPNLNHSFSANSIHSGGTISVALSYQNNSGQIKKPIIVVKGWDPWKIFNDSRMRITINTFLKNYIDSYGKYIGLGCLEVPINSQQGGGTLEGYLNDNGYDIVFLDYNDGTDDIKRNAKLLKEVISWVNQIKDGGQPNVVMGISMGGLVARWALREMENEGKDHQTVKLITIDSPHKGANIPVGVQAALYHANSLGFSLGIPGLVMVEVGTLSDYVSQLKQAMQVLNAPASKQMLIYKVSMTPTGNLTYDNSVHDAFQAEYDALGMPQKCMNIAISDGAGNGTAYFPPNAELINYSAQYSLKWWQEAINILTSGLTSSAALLTNYPQLAINIIPGKTEIKGECNINAIPSTPGRVYHARIYVTKKILWLIPVNADLTNFGLNSVSSMAPIDGVPGGGIDVDNFIDQTPITAGLIKQKKFCFVPAVSALALKDWKNYLTSNLNSTNFISNGQTPFDSYFSNMPTTNYEHTQFNSSADYILSKFVNCPDITPGSTISGPDYICGSTATFSIPPQPSGCKVIWDKSSNLNITSFSGNNANISATGNGISWISATINSGCLTVTLPQKTAWAGTPSISVSNISNLEDMGYGNYYKILPASGNYAFEGSLTVDVPVQCGLTNSTWNYYSGMPNKKIAYWSANNFTVNPGAKTDNAGEVIKFTAANTCGETYNYFNFFTGDLSGPPPLLAITPNPASSQAEVSIDEGALQLNGGTTEVNTTSISNGSPYQITVLNSFGVSVYSSLSSNKKIVIPTASIKNGIYVVRVTRGKEFYQGNLVVNH